MRDKRFRAVCRAAADFFGAGQHVFSPVLHRHALVEHGVPADWSFWERFDRQYVQWCDEVVVLMLDGWRQSTEVHAEIRLAAEFGKRVRYAAEQ